MTPTARSPTLQDDQKFALMKFRRSVSDILKPQHDDYFLVRWLNARSWNPEAAEKMLRESFKWRTRWGVDDIAKWQAPRALVEYSPHGLSGFDKEGSPIIIVPFAGQDMWGSLHSMSRADFIRGTIKNLEYYMNIGYEQSKKHGPAARQFVILFDMKDFSLKQYTWRPAGEVVIALIKNYEANYPEILKCCYIINVPKVFLFVFNIVKKFLDDYTISKIFLYKNNSSKWLPKLLTTVDPSQLPKCFGGTMTDPDGNPKCVSKINYGGTIPEDMYLDTSESASTSSEDFTETTIKKGGRLELTFKCESENTILRWEFRTIEHDIKFGVTRSNEKTGERNVEIELARVASHQLDEEGFISCLPNWTYTVLFDNAYSYFTNKRLRYAVSMTTALEVDELDLSVEPPSDITVI